MVGEILRGRDPTIDRDSLGRSVAFEELGQCTNNWVSLTIIF